MAKTNVTVALFVLFFAVAHARFMSDLTATRAFTTVDEDPVTILPETETETKSESTAVVAWDPETAGDKLTESESDDGPTTETESHGGRNFKSMTMITIRPINHARFPRLKFPFPDFRLSRRSRQKRQQRHQSRSKSGNDMTLAEERQKMESVFRHRQFPGRLMRLRNPGYRSGMINGEYMKVRHPHPHRHHHHTGKDEERHHEHDHKHEHKQEHEPANAFVKIRKFLASF